MKFCFILHFFIGLYMYTNYKILAPVQIKQKFFSAIKAENQYFN